MTTRQEHLTWCKQRALEYCDNDDIQGAFSSMASDIRKHPETSGHIGVGLGMAQLISGTLGDTKKMREFIEGFN